VRGEAAAAVAPPGRSERGSEPHLSLADAVQSLGGVVFADGAFFVAEVSDFVDAEAGDSFLASRR